MIDTRRESEHARAMAVWEIKSRAEYYAYKEDRSRLADGIPLSKEEIEEARMKARYLDQAARWLEGMTI